MESRQTGTPVAASSQSSKARSPSTSAPASPAEAAPARAGHKPQISNTPPPPGPPPLLGDYERIIGCSQLDELYYLASAVRGKTVKMVNSTAVGGGVAEMLDRLVPLLRELEVATRWDVISGGNDFFEVTKAFHNALQGAPYELSQSARDVFMAHNEQNRRQMTFEEDVVIIHDPQPAGLVASKSDHKAKWVWRCHIDLSNPNPDVWAFLRSMVVQYDAAVFSSPAFAQKLRVPQYLFYPCIDPLSEKNKELDESYITTVCDSFGIDRSRPIVTQVSRFDRMKDPVGVIHAYQAAKKYVDLQLVLAGGGASDDPEGNAVLEEVNEAAGNDPDVIILNLPPWSALEINALQRASTLIVQKSLREGFGLTVTEALWKRKPTIGSAVGGIPTQIVDRMTGILVHSVEGCAFQIRYLLTHPQVAQMLGENGHEHVKENFLMTTDLRRWLILLRILLKTA